jgi:hypothetical protein
VSRYAGTKPTEFVAEVFAGMQAGVKYDWEVTTLYRRFREPNR